MSSSKSARFSRLFLFIVVIPLIFFFAVDRAIVSNSWFWPGIADEIPLQIFDPYRIEGILRSISPGRHNVFILGDSTTNASLDPNLLNQVFAPSALEFRILSIGGASTVTFGLMTNSLSDLDPSAIIIFASPYTLRSRNYYEQIYSYDIRAVTDLFNKDEIFSHLPFHLAGLAGQANILIRHRHAMQRVGLIQLGLDSWGRIAREGIKRKLSFLQSRAESPLMNWVRDRKPEIFPNPNSRAIELLATHFSRRGAQFIVVESSIHPIFELVLQQQKLIAFRQQVENTLRDHGMTFISAPEMPVMLEADFDDHSHLSAQGKLKFTNALIPFLRNAFKPADPISR